MNTAGADTRITEASLHTDPACHFAAIDTIAATAMIAARVTAGRSDGTGFANREDTKPARTEHIAT